MRVLIAALLGKQPHHNSAGGSPLAPATRADRLRRDRRDRTLSFLRLCGSASGHNSYSCRIASTGSSREARYAG